MKKKRKGVKLASREGEEQRRECEHRMARRARSSLEKRKGCGVRGKGGL